jgi:antitoxin YefM
LGDTPHTKILNERTDKTGGRKSLPKCFARTQTKFFLIKLKPSAAGYSLETQRMIPVNEAQQQLQDLIDSVSQSHQPIVIAGQNNNAVLLSESDWAAVQETLYLLSIPGMRESIRAGIATPIEDCDSELEW